MLSRFNIILATDDVGGIGKNNQIPWNPIREDLVFFKKTTVGEKDVRNAVIMGRKTWDSLPEEVRPLKDRLNVVISETMDPRAYNSTDIIVCKTFEDALLFLGERRRVNAIGDVFVIGGQQLYNLAFDKYLYLCDYVYHTKVKGRYDCDRKVDLEYFKKLYPVGEPIRQSAFMRRTYQALVRHDEENYKTLLKLILEKGVLIKNDRTGTGTKQIFNASVCFSLLDNILPIITTKKTSFKTILHELLWFVRGQTDSKILEEKGVNIWKANSTKEFLERRNLPYREGDIGPGYGFQWRHSGTEYINCDTDYTGQGVDQLQNVIDGIKKDPWGRRHVVNSWNPKDLDKMALPPCHYSYQFEVEPDENGLPTYLHCTVQMRSADMFLGVPFNITSYSILTHMIAHLCNLKAKSLVINMACCHIYLNHINETRKLLERDPFPFPKISFVKPYNIQKLDDFNEDNIVEVEYLSHSKIAAKMAV